MVGGLVPAAMPAAGGLRSDSRDLGVEFGVVQAIAEGQYGAIVPFVCSARTAVARSEGLIDSSDLINVVSGILRDGKAAGGSDSASYDVEEGGAAGLRGISRPQDGVDCRALKPGCVINLSAELRDHERLAERCELLDKLDLSSGPGDVDTVETFNLDGSVDPAEV